MALVEEGGHLSDFCLTDCEGMEKYLDIFAWPCLDSSKQVSGVILFVEDVTEPVLRIRERVSFMDTLVHDLKVPVVGNDRILCMLEQNH